MRSILDGCGLATARHFATMPETGGAGGVGWGPSGGGDWEFRAAESNLAPNPVFSGEG